MDKGKPFYKGGWVQRKPIYKMRMDIGKTCPYNGEGYREKKDL